MNDLALILGSMGRIGSLERIVPEYIDGTINGTKIIWNGAIGMLKTSNIQYISDDTAEDNILITIIVNKIVDKSIELTEFYGVILYKPLDGLKWRDQISGFREKPSIFEAVHPAKLESKADYLFYSRRVIKTIGHERKKL
jgi:hypothetical protein